MHCKVAVTFQKVEVQAPPGTVCGYVYQSWSICTPKFHICDASDNTVLRIEGPCCTCNVCGDVEFQVTLPLREVRPLRHMCCPETVSLPCISEKL